MTAATTQSTPSVPPRPSRGADRDSSTTSVPRIPPRPSKKIADRSVSPNADRFAPSPLNEGIIAKSAAKPALLSPGIYGQEEDPLERAGSIPMPSVGQEGLEYDEIQTDDDYKGESSRAASPEQTRTVAQDLQLHAPKPSLPATSAKQRVEGVTRTDSDRAASFGIGYPAAPDERATSRDGIKNRPSTSFSASSDYGQTTDDDHGIPEIGQRVPMNPHLGDVQAPSPGPTEGTSRHHTRKHSARSLPPGSYGLHGHGVGPQDKLEKAYYDKHPDLLHKEEHTPIHDRQNDYAMSSNDLNKLVRQTASRGAGYGTVPDYKSTPTDEVAFQASEEYVRMTSPRPGSEQQKATHRRSSSSLAKVISNTSNEPDESSEGAVHVEDSKHPEYRSYGDESAADEEEDEYNAPILAPDEAEKDPSAHLQRPAIHPRPSERRGSSYESEDNSSRPISRPISRPTSVHINPQPEIRYTPLDDVEEYEPLFPEGTKKEEQPVESADENKNHNHFPSKDIWEDAPSSVHYTATVSTPDIPEHARTRSSGHHSGRPITPAQLFAQQQEQLAEQESNRRPTTKFLPLNEKEDKPTWAANQAHLKPDRPASGPRFPSRDVWEDAPESQLHQTVILTPEEERKPESPSQPSKQSLESSERPAMPTRPKPRQTSGDDVKPKPPVTDKPKPQIPARPTKAPSSSGKEKPPVPSRPVGNKIAALQAGFMSDLNRRLQAGQQAPKKEEAPEPEAAEETEKVPLSDARKSRARGPQRRAPAKSPAATKDPVKSAAPTLSFSIPQASWAIDPEEGTVTVDGEEVSAEEPAPVMQICPAKEEGEGEDKATEPEPKTEVQPESAPEPEPSAKEQEPEREVEDDDDDGGEPKKEQETLVSNMAGDSVLEATIEKKEEDTVEPVDVQDEVKS